MAVSELTRNIKRLWKLNNDRKALQKEEEALKTWFRHQAGGKDREFACSGIVVSVTNGHTTRVDLDQLRIDLRDKIKQYERETDTVTVKVAKMHREDRDE